MKSRILVGSLALSLMTGVIAGCSSSDPATGDSPTAETSSTVTTSDQAGVTKVTFSVPGMS